VPVSKTDSGLALFGGFALSLVMPGRLGELSRCLFLPANRRAPILLLNIFDRTIDSWALVTCAVVSLFLLVSRGAAVFAVGVWLVCLPLMLGLPALLAQLGGAPWWNERLRAPLRAASESLARVHAVRYAPWALVSTGLDLAAFFCLLRAFHDVELTLALASFPWIVLAGGLPVSIAGTGLREGASAWLLARHGIPSAAAFNAAILLLAFTSLLPALLGGLWLASIRVSRLWPRTASASGSSRSALGQSLGDWRAGLRPSQPAAIPSAAEEFGASAPRRENQMASPF